MNSFITIMKDCHQWCEKRSLRHDRAPSGRD